MTEIPAEKADFSLPDTIVLASANPHKVTELREILSGIGVKLKSTSDFPGLRDVIEDAETLHGNALKKAAYLYETTGLPALADDTGLEVDHLNGAPGVYSARYAGERATYEDNVNKLLRELGSTDNRSARFRTVIAFKNDSGTFFFNGVCEGRITKTPIGDNGFGYDPVFMPEGYNLTFAELMSEIKNNISHRGRAVKKFIRFLEEMRKKEA
ncbi:XTP/dITP diphosphohydrolase [Cyclonatronum proteinivorum]|uniref:dITP/XTP pyrophosphatase n=1 Tax=Cyclonatronum proteinivorum TaxID=1457365 RepID=A0A345UMA3_9BACT|nr:RdgB/HAM1 family non-canonical purine NTP pyrophosphatase [Cyclonatronum proteinivorum]AXJ01605.1 XTP/dITP diphosphohydrolase [Cyclonatronum proteinivorum]